LCIVAKFGDLVRMYEVVKKNVEYFNDICSFDEESYGNQLAKTEFWELYEYSDVEVLATKADGKITESFNEIFGGEKNVPKSILSKVIPSLSLKACSPKTPSPPIGESVNVALPKENQSLTSLASGHGLTLPPNSNSEKRKKKKKGSYSNLSKSSSTLTESPNRLKGFKLDLKDCEQDNLNYSMKNTKINLHSLPYPDMDILRLPNFGNQSLNIDYKSELSVWSRSRECTPNSTAQKAKDSVLAKGSTPVKDCSGISGMDSFISPCKSPNLMQIGFIEDGTQTPENLTKKANFNNKLREIKKVNRELQSIFAKSQFSDHEIGS
jgi:hypothetical protein